MKKNIKSLIGVLLCLVMLLSLLSTSAFAQGEIITGEGVDEPTIGSEDTDIPFINAKSSIDANTPPAFLSLEGSTPAISKPSYDPSEGRVYFPEGTVCTWKAARIPEIYDLGWVQMPENHIIKNDPSLNGANVLQIRIKNSENQHNISTIDLTMQVPAVSPINSTDSNVNGYINGTTETMEYGSDGFTWYPCSDGRTGPFGPGRYFVRNVSELAVSANAVVQIGASKSYPLWIAGEQVTSTNISNSIWEYNPNSHYLVIKDDVFASYSATKNENQLENGAAIYYKGTDTLKIQSNGKTVEACNGDQEIPRCFGIYASISNLIFEGSLSVIADSAKEISMGIFCDNEATIQAGANVAATGKTAEQSVGFGGAKKISVNGILTGTADKAGSESVGINAAELTLSSEASSVEGTGGESALKSYGILANTINIINGSLSGAAGDAYTMDEYGHLVLNNATSVGISATTSIAMTKGAMIGQGSIGTGSSYGIKTQSLTVDDGSVTASSSDAMSTSAAIDLTDGTAVIRGGRVDAAYAGTGTSNNFAINKGTITQQGGEITASADGLNTIGISSAITLNGNAKLTATSSSGIALANKPTYTIGYGKEVRSGTSEATAAVIPTANLEDLSSYQKNYVSIRPIVATTGIRVKDIPANKRITLGLGESRTLEVEYTPETATDRELTWISSNPSAVTVQDGVIRAVGNGNSNVSVYLTSSQGGVAALRKTFRVDVSSIPVSGITITNPTNQRLSIAQGEIGYIEYSIAPASASSKGVTPIYDSSKVSVVPASGSSNKLAVTGLMPGQTTVTLEAQDGSGMTALCYVDVTAKTYVNEIKIINAAGGKLESLSFATTGGTPTTIYFSILPSTATDKRLDIRLEKNDNTVILLDPLDPTSLSRVVYPMANGSDVLVVTAMDGSDVQVRLPITVRDATASYRFTYKENSGVWYYDYGTLATYTVKCDGPCSSFSRCLMDGYIISPNYYYKTEGSTIVTFYPQYMQTLSHGRHTLTFVYNDTTTVSTYIWSRSLRDPPITGDSGTAGLIAAMSVSALAAASCTFFVRKKKEN